MGTYGILAREVAEGKMSLQEGQNSKDGKLFASASAREHDYIAINGMFLPNQTRKDNARVHQRL